METLCKVKLEPLDEELMPTTPKKRLLTIVDDPIRLQGTPATSRLLVPEKPKLQRNEFFSTSHLSPAKEIVKTDDLQHADKQIKFSLPMKRIEKYAPPPPPVRKPVKAIPTGIKNSKNVDHAQNPAVKMFDTCTLTAMKLRALEYRHKNNEASKRSRRKNKIVTTQIQSEEEVLSSKNDKLQSQYNDIDAQIKMLRKYILDTVNADKVKIEIKIEKD